MTLRRNRNNFQIHFLIALALLFHSHLPVSAAHIPAGQVFMSSLALSGVSIQLALPFHPPDFIPPAPDDAQQIATAVAWNPFFEISLESEPTFLRDADSQVRSLQALRSSQAGSEIPGRQIRFFGQSVRSVSNQVMLVLRTADSEPVVVHEWVTQAYQRAWTFRISYTPGQGFDESLLDQIAITGREPAPGDTAFSPSPPAQVRIASLAALAEPDWWQGDCDVDHYYSKSGLNAYPLGGSYRGVKACGPRPWSDGAPDVLVRFFSGAWGEYEWECVELSMRFLYLAYGIAPYPGNGKDVVANYSGVVLTKIANGTVGKAPQPGDVLSYGPTTAYGHTSVVSASSVNASGNGTITVIEQNSSATGSRTLTVSGWTVLASSTVSGWLHLPDPTVEFPQKLHLPWIIGQ